MTPLLLNPGPVTLTPRVRAALSKPDLCHRESDYFDLQDGARRALLDVYDLDAATWAPVLITGSGTAAVEAMIASLVPDGGRVLVIDNGVYGDRIAQIAERYRIDHDVLKHDWFDGPDLAAIADRLDRQPRCTHVAVVHHETTTGRLNDLAAIDALCAARGVALLVDGVSSFGAEDIRFDGAIVAVAAAANKCLHGVPGVSFVVARRDALATAASRAFYLDLGRAAALQDRRNTPFTPAIHGLYALVEALAEFVDDGGRTARHARYAALASRVRAGFGTLGIAALLPPADTSVVLTAYRLPEGLGYDTLHDGLKARGFVIYAGQGGLASTLFRISTMGAVTPDDMDRLVDDVRAIVADRSAARAA